MNDERLITINDRLNIPLSELEFRFSQSSGPGGQHVNKAETQASLFFDVLNSPSLDESSRQRLLAKLGSRLDRNGVLQISVQETRSQYQNREIAIARFQELLSEALKVPKKRRPTRPSRAARESRLANKKRRSRLKQDRRWRWER